MRRILSVLLAAALLLASLTSCDHSAEETTVTTSALEPKGTIDTTITEEIIATTTASNAIDISVYDKYDADYLEELRQYLNPKMILEGYTVIDFPHEGSYAKYMSYRKYYWYLDHPLEKSVEKAYYKEYDRQLTWEDFTSIYRGMPTKDLVESVGLPNGEIMGRAYYELSDGTFAVLISDLYMSGAYDEPYYSFGWSYENDGNTIFDVIHVDQQGNAFRRGLSTENFFELDTVDSDEYIMIEVPTEKENEKIKLISTQDSRTLRFSSYATYKPTERQLTVNDFMAVLERNMPASEITSLLGEPNGLIEMTDSDVGVWHPYYLLDNGTYAILEIAYPEWHTSYPEKLECDVFYDLILLLPNGDVYHPFDMNAARADGKRFLQLPDGRYAMCSEIGREADIESFEALRYGMSKDEAFQLVGDPDGYVCGTDDYLYRLNDGSFLVLHREQSKNEKNETVNILTEVYRLNADGSKPPILTDKEDNVPR